MALWYARMSRLRRGDSGPTRREVLAATLAASAGLLFPRGARAEDPGPSANRVVVIGAGFAGLAAAHELVKAGYDVTVLEARERVGGRVLSFHDLVPGKNVEGGGELIGSNHPAWVAYAAEFGLEFLDVTEDEELEYPVHLGGRLLGAEEAGHVWEEMDEALAGMNEDAAKVDADRPWASEGAKELDARTVRSWIRTRECSDLAKRGMDVLLASDNGAATDAQSYLGLLASVKGGGVERYWTESEVYRCRGGNDQLARRLAGAVGEARIRTKAPVAAVKQGDRGVAVTLADGSVVQADDVVVAVPPSTWSRIAFDPPLPPGLAPQMGSNVKWLAATKGRFWLETKTSPYALADGDVSQTWEGTDNQPGDEGACLVAFSGGPASEATRRYPKDQRTERYLLELERSYPALRKSFLQARYMDWPSDAWTGASYSFPAPGQVTTVGPMLREGVAPRLHFAGEHCCYAFVGFMEGALQSGIAVARRLAARDGIEAR